MAYNNYFPVTYNPVGYQYPYNQQMIPQQPQMSYTAPQNQQSNGIVWVQGEAAAKAYPVAPGSNALLMDSEGECFYIKSTDASGMPLPLRTFEYHEVINSQQSIPQASSEGPRINPDDYIKKSEYEDLKKEIEELKTKLLSSNDMAPKQKIEGRSTRNG